MGHSLKRNVVMTRNDHSQACPSPLVLLPPAHKVVREIMVRRGHGAEKGRCWCTKGGGGCDLIKKQTNANQR